MIKSREDLMALSNEWAVMAKNDLRNQLMGFMEEMNTSEDELAYALGISVGELLQILEGNGEITLSTFAKILIANENVIEIKPLAEVGGMPPMPRGGRMPQRAMARGGMPQMPQGGMPRGQMPQMPQGGMPRGGMPQMPQGGMPRGQMPQMPQGGMPRGGMRRFGGMPGMGNMPQPQEQMPIEAMSRPQLVEIIERNFWDSEIDVRGATRDDLVGFLLMKEDGQNLPTAKRREDKVQLVQGRDTAVEAVDPTADFLSMIQQELENNPHLREEIGKYLPKN